MRILGKTRRRRQLSFGDGKTLSYLHIFES